MADARCISGGDEADGAAGFSGDEDNYGYKNHVDDDDNSDSEQEPDFTNRSALGPKDGEGEADETYLVAFRAMCGRIPGPLATNIIKLLGGVVECQVVGVSGVLYLKSYVRIWLDVEGNGDFWTYFRFCCTLISKLGILVHPK